MKCVFPVNNRKNTISWDINSTVSTLHLIIDKEAFSRHILKLKWLVANEARDKNIIQQTSFAFDDD